MIAGIFAIICCSILLGIAPTLQNVLLEAGYSVTTMNFFANILETAFLFLICFTTKRNLHITKKQLLHLAMCAFLGLGATGLLLNNAYKRIPVGTTTMLHFLYPTMVCIYMSVFRKERFTRLRAMAVVSSVGGMVLLCGGQALGLDFLGVVLALLSTLTYGFYVVFNGSGDLAELDVIVKPMYIYAFSSLEMFALTACAGGFQHPPIQKIHVLVILLVAVCFSIAAICITFSIRKIGAAATSFFNMLEPVVSFTVSALFFHDTVTWKMVLGCGLVLCAASLITIDQKRGREAASA